MFKKNNNSINTFIIITLLISALGGVIIYHATNWGPWAFSDSAVYVSAARNFSSGNGFVIQNANNSFTHMTEFPPFYSIFLSIFLGADGNPTIIVRWINIFLFAAFITIFGSFLYYFTKNILLSLIGMLFIISAPVMIEIFTGVMSETLFLPMLLIIFFLVGIYIQHNEKQIFVLLIVLSTLLPITRYAGALFIVVSAGLLFAFSKNSLSKRIQSTLTYLAISLTPLMLWFVKLYIQFDKVGGKSFNIGFGLIQSIFKGVQAEFDVLKTWLPYYGIYDNSTIDNTLAIGSLILFFALVYITFHNYRRKNKSQKNAVLLFSISLSYLCAYVLFIAFTHSVTIPQIDIIDRMMAPVYLLFIIMLITGIGMLLNKKTNFIFYSAIAVCLVALRFSFMITFVYVEEMNQLGRGYSAREYQEAGIIDHLRTLPNDQRLISNSSGFVLYHINLFPLQVDQFSNRTYGRHNGYGERAFREKDGALILIYPDFRNYYGKSAEQLLSTITDGLEIVYQDDVSGIYSYSEEKSTQP